MNCSYCNQWFNGIPPWDEPVCPDCGDIDPADLDLREFEETHRIWFDDKDQPRLSEGYAGFYENAVQLSEIRA